MKSIVLVVFFCPFCIKHPGLRWNHLDTMTSVLEVPSVSTILAHPKCWTRRVTYLA